MTLAQRVLRGHPGRGVQFLYNGQAGDGHQRIGLARSSDRGLTWHRYGTEPVFDLGSGGSWDDELVHGPSVLWDGSQYVMFYGGYDGSNWKVGRATSPDLTTWTRYGSNPVIGLGTAGAFDDAGALFPIVRKTADSPAWQMWYTGSKAGGKTTLGYADSTDGLSWTKRGQVLSTGSPGDFDDEGMETGPVLSVGGTNYLFYAGQASTGPTWYDWSGGYATFTSPTGTYTKHGGIADFAGTLTLSDGLTYRSNGPTSILARGDGTYTFYCTAFQPTPDIGQHEVSFRATTSDLTNFTDITGPLLTMGLGGWDDDSAENPCVVIR